MSRKLNPVQDLVAEIIGQILILFAFVSLVLLGAVIVIAFWRLLTWLI